METKCYAPAYLQRVAMRAATMLADEKYADDLPRLAVPIGKLCKAAEAFDHLEEYPYAEAFRANVAAIEEITGIDLLKEVSPTN